MDYYNIEFKKSALKDLRKLPVSAVRKINNNILLLKENPYPQGYKKLIHSKTLYRIRIGDYRVVYSVITESKLVIIQYIRHRKDVYKNL